MVVGGIVEYSSAEKRYSLPPEHAAFTTRAAGIDNLALFSQYISLMGLVEDKVVDCFRKGGGYTIFRVSRFPVTSSRRNL